MPSSPSIPATITVFRGSPSRKIIQSTIPKPTLTGHQVLVEVHHACLCGTDLHFLDKDLALGHEGAGVVKEVGPATRYLKVDDRVGFGWFHDSCGHCENCIVGDGAHCQIDSHQFGLTELDTGGWSNYIIWAEDFLYPIPDGLSTEQAAPLMCAGMTVFTPMARYGLKATDRVGIIGVGALGHLAIQFASKMGCDVVVFSRTAAKEEEARRLGARTFVVTEGQKELKLEGKLLNHLFASTSDLPDFNQYFPLMAPFGTIYPLTIAYKQLSFDFMPFQLKDLAIRGSTGGSRLIFQQMMEFVVLHGIHTIFEKFPLSLGGLAKARARLEGGELRYKAVLEAEGCIEAQENGRN